MKPVNFTYKVLKNNKVIERLSTHKKRKFLRELRTINFQIKTIEVSLRVYYGRHKNALGKIVVFANDGVYKTKKDLMLAYRAFINL